MRTKIIEARDGQVEIAFDGQTVWVNDWASYCIGRYSLRISALDVHALRGDKRQCVDCRTGTLLDFAESMHEHHGVQIAPTLRMMGADI